MVMSDQNKKLFLLDAYALIYRAHFAFSKNPRITSRGKNTGVMFGFTNSLLEVLQKQEPTHIGVAFDTHHPTFRHKKYKEYKANRQETPEDVKDGIPVVKEIVKAFNIPVLEMPGFEADDIIGTLAKKAETEGFTVYMMTPDKDFGQLVDENIFLYKPAYMGNAVDVMGVDEVKAKWGIERVDQVRDMLGLQGDASDNIPGIPGVGPKTAQKYIHTYGSVEELVAHSHELKGKQKENVENFGEQGILSKELATIALDVPIDFDAEALKYSGPDEASLRPIFEDLEFRTLIQRVFSGGASKPVIKSSPEEAQLDLFAAPKPAVKEEILEEEITREKSNFYTLRHFQHVLTSKSEVESLVQFLVLQKKVAISLAKSGISVDAEWNGLALCYQDDESFYIPLPKNSEGIRELLSPLYPIFKNENIIMLGHDIKSDLLMFLKNDIPINGPFSDTMLTHYLLDSETRHALDLISENSLGYFLFPEKEIVSEDPIYDTAIRTCERAEVIFRLSNMLDPEIERLGLSKLLNEVELPLLEVLTKMEFEGIRLESSILNTQSESLEKEIKSIQTSIYKDAGEEFNINSPKQLGVILFEKLHLLEKPKKTKSGQYATGEEILTRLGQEHPIVSKILDYRELQKLKSTYVDALPGLVSSLDGRIHTTLSQAVAATGRLSSINPNLQNIPIRTEKGREVRKAFVPRNDDFVLLSADYSQIELRIIASFSGDKAMIEAFREGRDIHTTTASRVFGVPAEEVNEDMRRMAKSTNFGIIYGISAFGLSQNLNIPRKEAAEIIDSYFKEFPSVKQYMDNAINEAKENEFVTTILGRKRFLRDINSRNATTRGYSERNAINAPIQGSAADLIKIAMVSIQRWMEKENLQSRMILQVHDELLFDAHKDEIELLSTNVEKFMKSALELKVPLEVSIGTGKNWLDAH